MKLSDKKADYEKISHFISNVDWFMLNENISVQDMCDELIFYANIACNAFIPSYESSEIKNSAAPWINDELRALFKVIKQTSGTQSVSFSVAPISEIYLSINRKKKLNQNQL